MNYLIFANRQLCDSRNNQIAIAKGSGKPGDVTVYWFASIGHPRNSEWAMMVDDNTLITPQEVSQLKDYAYMNANGWFEKITP